MAYVAAAAVFALVSLTALFAGGDACFNFTEITRTVACQQTDRWANLCLQTLQGTTPDIAEATVYALQATTMARIRYENTLSEVETMLWPGGADPWTVPDQDNCKVKYGVALRRIASVEDQLNACDFAYNRQEYIDAEVGVRSCQDGLLRLPEQYHSWQLFKKVSDDRELTMVAYLLGAIFLGR